MGVISWRNFKFPETKGGQKKISSSYSAPVLGGPEGANLGPFPSPVWFDHE